MTNEEQQTREEFRDMDLAEGLSEAELDTIIGGGANVINTSRSNTKEN